MSEGTLYNIIKRLVEFTNFLSSPGVDNMPLEVQRHVSHMREVELETTHVMSEIERLRCELVQSVSEGEAPTRQQAILAELKRCMLKAREIGDAKLDMSSQMLNIVCLNIVSVHCIPFNIASGTCMCTYTAPFHISPLPPPSPSLPLH